MLTMLVLLISAFLAPVSLFRNDAPAIETRVSIRPVTEDAYQLLKRPEPGMYRCTVVVLDEPGSKRQFRTKDILVGPGGTGEETTVVGPLEVKVKASISRSLEHAEATVTVARDGKVVLRQTSDVSLVKLARPY